MAKLSEGDTISMIGEVPTRVGIGNRNLACLRFCQRGAETPLIIARHKNGSRRIGISLAE